MQAERPWRLVASLAVSLTGSAIVLTAWSPVARGLWDLATVTPIRPINPVGFSLFLVGGAVVGLVIGVPAMLLALKLSRRPLAEAGAIGVQLASLLAISGPILMIAIVWIRGIEVRG